MDARQKPQVQLDCVQKIQPCGLGAKTIQLRHTAMADIPD
jgi:hypothetical protein